MRAVVIVLFEIMLTPLVKLQTSLFVSVLFFFSNITALIVEFLGRGWPYDILCFALLLIGAWYLVPFLLYDIYGIDDIVDYI